MVKFVLYEFHIKTKERKRRRKEREEGKRGREGRPVVSGGWGN
jgi:hypothetical protein